MLFFIYLIALGVLVFTGINIPRGKKDAHFNKKIQGKKVTLSIAKLSILGCAVYAVFFLMPTDVAFLIRTIAGTDVSSAAALLAIEILAASFAGILFSRYTHRLGLYAFSVGFVLCALGFFLVIYASSFMMLAACVVAIGLGIGTLRPMIYLHTAQICPLGNTTSAFAFINSAFSFGQFISPFFYFGVSSLFTFTIQTGSYLTAAIIFCAAGIISLGRIKFSAISITTQ